MKLPRWAGRIVCLVLGHNLIGSGRAPGTTAHTCRTCRTLLTLRNGEIQ